MQKVQNWFVPNFIRRMEGEGGEESMQFKYGSSKIRRAWNLLFPFISLRFGVGVGLFGLDRSRCSPGCHPRFNSDNEITK